MRHLTFLAAALALLSWSAAAQTQPAAQASGSASGSTAATAGKSGAQASGNSSAAASAQAGHESAALAGGTAMQAELTHPVDAKKSKPGDTVTAKNTEAVASNGQVVIPKGSKLIGHVTEARPHEKKSKDKPAQESVVGIAWDKAVLKNGQEVPLNASIQALAAAENQLSSGPETQINSGAMGSGSAGYGRSPGMGGVTSTAGGVVGGATNTVGNVGAAGGGAAGGVVNSTGRVESAVGGLNANGELLTNSRGVFGMNGVNLTSAAANSTQGSLITSPNQDVHLDSGTRMLLVAEGGAQHGDSAAAEPRDTHAPREPR